MTGYPRQARTALNVVPGARFGRLVVVELVPPGDGAKRTRARCRCDCGGTRLYMPLNLAGGRSTSCGCLKPVRVAADACGAAGTPDYSIWRGMLTRCLDPLNKDYPNYGGRGITVCERWLSFANFTADMGPRPTREHSLDRRDNDRGYEPGNVRWATPTQQSRNRRGIAFVTLNGARRPVVEVAAEYGIPVSTLKHRLRRGESPEAAVAGSAR